ncbi:MAG: cytochrome P450 [Acidimicrobiales bacterium]
MNIDDIDLLAETWGERVPHEEFDLLRAEDPVHWHPEPNDTGFWAVTRHEDVVAVSRDPETYSSEIGSPFVSTQDNEALAQIRLSIIGMDGAKHHRYRRLVSKGFTPRVIARLEEQIVERAAAIMDDVCERGECEFVEEVAAKLPLQMICDMIGLPESDWDRMFHLSNMLVGFDDPDFVATPEDTLNASMEIYAYCDAIANDRRQNPQDDLMTALVQAEIDGDRLDDLELNLFFVTLVVAGNETTRNLITHGTLALIEHPEQAKLLRTEPEHYPTAVDEMLRWGSSIHNFRRTATKDTMLGGQQIKAGDKVVIYYLAANYDPDMFDDPHTFDVTRSPNDHVAFGGGGIHYCLGANLARSEIKAMIREVVERMPDLELAGDVRRLRSDFINGIKSMPVRFTPTPRRSSAVLSGEQPAP